MRNLIVTQNVTLDGVIDAAEGWFNPSDDDEMEQADVIEALQEQSVASDALLVGRLTFEQMRGYWPTLDEDPTGVRDHLNAVEKYVVSRSLEDPEWERSTVLRGPLADEVRALKERDGKDIVATGSMSLMPELVASGLVDEYRLFVYPVVIGRGQRLFADATNMPKLRLAESRAFRSGITLLRYRAER